MRNEECIQSLENGRRSFTGKRCWTDGERLLLKPGFLQRVGMTPDSPQWSPLMERKLILCTVLSVWGSYCTQPSLLPDLLPWLGRWVYRCWRLFHLLPRGSTPTCVRTLIMEKFDTWHHKLEWEMMLANIIFTCKNVFLWIFGLFCTRN